MNFYKSAPKPSTFSFGISGSQKHVPSSDRLLDQRKNLFKKSAISTPNLRALYEVPPSSHSVPHPNGAPTTPKTSTPSTPLFYGRSWRWPSFRRNTQVRNDTEPHRSIRKESISRPIPRLDLSLFPVTPPKSPHQINRYKPVTPHPLNLPTVKPLSLRRTRRAATAPDDVPPHSHGQPTVPTPDVLSWVEPPSFDMDEPRPTNASADDDDSCDFNDLYYDEPSPIHPHQPACVSVDVDAQEDAEEYSPTSIDESQDPTYVPTDVECWEDIQDDTICKEVFFALNPDWNTCTDDKLFYGCAPDGEAEEMIRVPRRKGSSDFLASSPETKKKRREAYVVNWSNVSLIPNTVEYRTLRKSMSQILPLCVREDDS